MRRSNVPTPALLVDIDILDRNIALMRDCSTALGVNRRLADKGPLLRR
jgi:D-serine deaminase-like pyridoxal phosphate-dependent protein